MGVRIDLEQYGRGRLTPNLKNPPATFDYPLIELTIGPNQPPTLSVTSVGGYHTFQSWTQYRELKGEKHERLLFTVLCNLLEREIIHLVMIRDRSSVRTPCHASRRTLVAEAQRTLELI